eukprot:scaffold168483_cov21-Tisochrysis_lutea.AAC.1
MPGRSQTKTPGSPIQWLTPSDGPCHQLRSRLLSTGPNLLHHYLRVPYQEAGQDIHEVQPGKFGLCQGKLGKHRKRR